MAFCKIYKFLDNNKWTANLSQDSLEVTKR